MTILEAGRDRLLDKCGKLIDRTTGQLAIGFQTWDTKEQEGTIYNPDIYTEFTIRRYQYPQLAREYGGRKKLNDDIEHNRVRMNIID